MKTFTNKYGYTFPYVEIEIGDYDPQKTALKVNDLTLAFSEWWDFYTSLFEQVNGFGCIPSKAMYDAKVVKIPFISKEEMWNLGL